MSWIASPENLRAFLFGARRLHEPARHRVLMVAPDFFRVEYAINPYVFEGNGDCIGDPSFPLLWGGYGPRTELAVYSDISRRTGFSVAPLELIDPDFYHLDTCFSILGSEAAAVLPAALAPASLALVRERFSTLIELDRKECHDAFAGNCHWVGGKDVVLSPGAPALEAKLKALGYSAHLVATSEFQKAGGSVFCLKMACF